MKWNTTTVQGPLTSAEWQLPTDPTGLRITFQRHKVSFKEMREASHKHLLLPTPNDLWLAKTLHDTDCAVKPPHTFFSLWDGPIIHEYIQKTKKAMCIYTSTLMEGHIC